MLKIDSAASARSHGKYMKSFRFPWPPVVAARDCKRGLHEHCVAAEVTGSIKTTLLHRIELCLSDPTIPFKFLQKMIFDQNRICCDDQYGERTDA